MSAGPNRPARPAGAPGGRIARNALANGAGFVSGALIAFFIAPFLVRHLGEGRYGAWILVNSLAGYLLLLELGLRLAVKRFVAVHLARSGGGRLDALITTAVTVLGGAGAVALAATLVLVWKLGALFAIPPADLLSARIALLLVGTTVSLSLPFSVHAGILSGLQRYDVANALTVVAAAVRASLIALAVGRGCGLEAMAVVHASVSLFLYIAQVAAVRRLLPGVALGPRRIDREALAELSAYGIWTFVLDVADRLIFYTGAVVIAAFSSVAAVAAFSVATQLVEYARQLVSSLVAVMTPAFGDLHERADGGRLRETFVRGARGAAIVALPIALGLAILGDRFIALWMGAAMARGAGPVLAILAAPLVLALPQFVACSLVLGVGRHRPLALWSLGQAAATAVLALALVRPLGASGVALGIALPLAATYALFYPRLVARTVGLGPLAYLRRAFGPPALLAVPLALADLALRARWQPRSLAEFLATMALAAAAYGGLAWAVCLRRRGPGAAGSAAMPSRGEREVPAAAAAVPAR